MTNLANGSDRTLYVKDGPLALPRFAQHRINLLKQAYTNLEIFEDACEHYEGCDTP